jgi:hypothetical protein
VAPCSAGGNQLGGEAAAAIGAVRAVHRRVGCDVSCGELAGDGESGGAAAGLRGAGVVAWPDGTEHGPPHTDPVYNGVLEPLFRLAEESRSASAGSSRRAEPAAAQACSGVEPGSCPGKWAGVICEVVRWGSRTALPYALVRPAGPEDDGIVGEHHEARSMSPNRRGHRSLRLTPGR